MACRRQRIDSRARNESTAQRFLRILPRAEDQSLDEGTRWHVIFLDGRGRSAMETTSVLPQEGYASEPLIPMADFL